MYSSRILCKMLFYLLSLIFKIKTVTCDLNLQIDEDGFICTPMTSGELACLWGNVRSNFGVKQGKVCFQIKVGFFLICLLLPSI